MTVEIESKILLIRAQRVMLDADLAPLYGVQVSQLNRAVRRNAERFPADFMFQLTSEECANLKCQFGISSSHGGRRHAPYAFTEQGVAMLSSVLRSPRAIEANIAIVRAFVRLRRLLSENRTLSRRLDELESRCDGKFRIVFNAIRRLMDDKSPIKRIGFKPKEAGGS